MEKNIIAHHGIKGQKWGVRRFQNTDGSLTADGKKRYDNNDNYEIIESRRQDIVNRRQLSNDDIRSKIERLKLEKELKSLTNEDVNPGKTYALNILKSAGTKFLTPAVAGAAAYTVKAIMEKKFSMKEAAGYIAANPNKKK